MQYNTLPLYPELFGRARVSITLMTVQLRPTTLSRGLRLLFVLLLAVSAAGCAKFMYNRLDTLAAWYIGDLVSLDDQQRADVRAWLGQTLQWHRTSELGRYATFLRELYEPVAKARWGASYVSLPQAWMRQARRFCQVLWIERA